MARVVFELGYQRKFLREIHATGLSWDEMAKISQVAWDTLRDWRRERRKMRYEAVENLCRVSGVDLPPILEILPDNPGTPEGRRKGGLHSCKKQQESGKGYYLSKFVVRKKVNLPEESAELAEAIGIILGDGSITQFQVTVSVSALVDAEYADFIRSMFETLFHIEVFRQPIRKNTISQTVSSRSLVEFLLSKGLVKGDKVRQQVDIPAWIKAEPNFLKACIRGLFDTDGSIYYHHHVCKGKECLNIGAVFTSFSPPLCNSFHRFLISQDYRAKLSRGSRVYLYRQSEIIHYLQEIGTHNPKHRRRLEDFINHLK